MKIAVNTRFLMTGKLEGFGIYTHEIMSRMVDQHPDDQFHFYFDRKVSGQFKYADNVSTKTLFPPARHPLLFRIWYDWSLRRALKKSRPDVFFSPDSFMPLNCPVRSVITIHDIAHRRYPDSVPPHILRYFDNYLPQYLERADKIITVSQFSRDEICEWYGVSPDKIEVIHNGVSQRFHPLSDDDIRKQRIKWSGDEPYFLYVGAIHPRKNLEQLIRAYSAFRNQSSLKYPLLIAGRKSWQWDAVEKALDDSDYKDDIRFLGYVPDEQLPGLIGAASIFLYLSLYEGFGLPVVEAFASGVPVICSNRGALAEVAGDAALLADPEYVEAITYSMRTLAGDADLQSRLKERGLERAKEFSWKEAAEETYQVLANV